MNRQTIKRLTAKPLKEYEVKQSAIMKLLRQMETKLNKNDRHASLPICPAKLFTLAF